MKVLGEAVAGFSFIGAISSDHHIHVVEPIIDLQLGLFITYILDYFGTSQDGLVGFTTFLAKPETRFQNASGVVGMYSTESHS